MIGWAILYAILFFIAFISLLIGVPSWIMGTINKDRGWVVFSYRVLGVTLVAVALLYTMRYTMVKSWINHLLHLH